VTVAGARPFKLFFALWPSDDQRAALVALTGPAIAPIAGKPVQSANLHVTLAFLGSVPGQGVEDQVAVGGRVEYHAI
jgi:2'-5' RNA ligase